MLIGVLIPDVGAFLLLLIPPQGYVPEAVIRLLMLIGVLVVPGVVGAMTLLLTTGEARTPRSVIGAIARGYPLTLLLAALLVFLAGLAIWRKGTSLARRWNDAHVPMVVKPGAYEQVAHDLDEALSAAGLDLAAGDAPASMSLPAKWLTAVAGRSSSSLVPDRMVRLRGDDLDILIDPMDVLIAGKGPDVVRARAAIASRLTTSAAHLTVSAEAQAVEDRLARVAGARNDGGSTRPVFDDAAAAEFADIDRTLATIRIPYEEWEVLYRQRLQVERDLRAGAMAGEAVLGATSPDRGAAAAVGSIGRLLRRGAMAVIDAATDDETIEAIDKLMGVRGRLVAQAADAVVDAARAATDESSQLAEEPRELAQEPAPEHNGAPRQPIP
jgi:hypothetical protein